jgi:Na+-driven multidrug efflux pump
MGILSMWCLWVPLAWILGLNLHWGLPGIWISMTIDEWFRGITMYWRWKRRSWLKYAERSRHAVATENIPLVAES